MGRSSAVLHRWIWEYAASVPSKVYLWRRNYRRFSFDTLPEDGELPGDPASVRFRSIAEIMRRGIHRYVAVDRELRGASQRPGSEDEPVLGNLGDSLPEPLDFASDKALSVSRVSKTLGIGNAHINSQVSNASLP